MKKQKVAPTTKILLVTLVMAMLTSCGTASSNSGNLTKESRTVNYDTDKMYSEITSIMQSGDTSQYDNVKMEFDSNDIITVDDSARYYFYQNSVYIQTSDVMYRFQLDADNNIISYIKYGLEG